MASEAEIKERFSQLDALLDERTRWLWAVAESDGPRTRWHIAGGTRQWSF